MNTHIFADRTWELAVYYVVAAKAEVGQVTSLR